MPTTPHAGHSLISPPSRVNQGSRLLSDPPGPSPIRNGSRVERGSREIDDAAEAIRARLMPRDAAERLLVDQVVRSVECIASAEDHHLDPIVELRRLESALQALDRLRALTDAKEKPSLENLRSSQDDHFALNQSSHGQRSSTRSAESLPTSSPGDEPFLDQRWRERLEIDPNICQESPTVRGTHVTVNQINSMLIDGLSWDDLLGRHPELVAEDIRACLAYSLEQDGFLPQETG